MQVIFHGHQTSEEVAESLLSIIKMFKERYAIEDFRELKLSMTLMDKQGDDVELVDSHTSEVFHVFEVHKTLNGIRPLEYHSRQPHLRLVVDNS